MSKNRLIRYLLVTILTIITGRSYAQYDSIAIAILDSMSDEISTLETFSYKFTSEYDAERK